MHVTEEDTHKGVFQSQDLSTSTKKKFSDMMQELSQRVYYQQGDALPGEEHGADQHVHAG